MLFECQNHLPVPAQFLFNQDVYLRQHNIPFCTAYINAPHSYVCRMSETASGHYTSGFKATFGGIEGTDAASLDAFIKELIAQLKLRKASSLTLKQVPFCYHPEFYNTCHEILLSNGFTLQVSDVNQYIQIDPSVAFDATLDNQKRRLLRRLKEAGAECRLFETIHDAAWYELYKTSRLRKGFSLSLQQPEYEQLSATIPGIYTYAGVFLNNKLIANAIIVRVSKDVLYYFVAAADADYNALSPSVMLIEKIYEIAVSQQYSMIDLGISSVDGVLNEGLYFFKKHAGAMDSTKNIYTMHL